MDILSQSSFAGADPLSPYAKAASAVSVTNMNLCQAQLACS